MGTDLGDERDLVDREEAEEREKGASASTTMSTLMTTTPSSDSPLPRPFAPALARGSNARTRERRGGVFRATPPGGDPMSVVPPEIARRFASPKRNANGHYEAVAALCDPTTAAELLKAWLRALARRSSPRGCTAGVWSQRRPRRE